MKDSRCEQIKSPGFPRTISRIDAEGIRALMLQANTEIDLFVCRYAY